MLTPEQFAERQAQERAAFERQQSVAARIVAAGVPAPDYIGGALFGALGITYRNLNAAPRDLVAALEIFEGFAVVVPHNVLKNSCTITTPEKDLPEKDRARGYRRDTLRLSGSYAIRLDVCHIADSTAPTRASLEFFARAGGLLLRVSVEFGRDYIGACRKLAPVASEERDRRSSRLISRTFSANGVAAAHADGVLSFASGDMGPVKKSADHRYLFAATHGDDDSTPAECQHARDQLRIIAAALNI